MNKYIALFKLQEIDRAVIIEANDKNDAKIKLWQFFNSIGLQSSHPEHEILSVFCSI